jgi:hypothetical protein
MQNKNNRNVFRKVSEVILFYFLLCSFILQQGEDPRLSRLVNHLKKFRTEYPQQKVYVQLDKPTYSAGENIWLKAYLVNAASGLPDTMSTNLFIELINARNIRVQAHMLQLKGGFASGDFILRDTVTEGNYLIKAYTGWMNNFDEGLIFKKHIYIKNPQNKNFISSRDIRFNRKFNRTKAKLSAKQEIQFLPEGGEMVTGLRTKVAFKAINGSGKGVDAEGVIKDNQGITVAELHSIHLGMGAFVLTPQAGKSYEAWVKLGSAAEQKIKLPQPLINGITISADNLSSEEFLRLRVRANLPSSNDELIRDFIILAQTNGNTCFSGVFHLTKDSLDLSIPKSKFPTGISQITLFNGRGNPVAERLVFINHHDELTFDLSTTYDTIHNGNQLLVKLKVQDKEGKPVTGNFSASFTNAELVSENEDESNILNSFWLTSDIKGVVEKPGWYFNSDQPEREVSLDLLMLTQGWRRFDWKKIIADQYPVINYPEEKGISISGQITRDFFGIPVKKAPVYLTVLSSYNDYFTTTTDEKGLFKFGNLLYFDTMSVVVEATKPNGKKSVQILIDELHSPKANVQSVESFEQEVLVKGEDWQYKNVKQNQANNNRIKERQERREKYASSRIYNQADNIIYMEDIPDSYQNMFQVIQGRVPGVMVGRNSVIIRGVNTLFGDTDPLYLIDGIAVDASTFGNLNPKDVEMVEFLKGPNAAIFGSRGSNGVIAAYTKRGEFMKRGYYDFKMLAYYTPRIFYTTSLPSEKNPGTTDSPETLYWKPEIKTGPTGEASISFRIKEKMPLRAIIEGISFAGIPGYLKSQIRY